MTTAVKIEVDGSALRVVSPYDPAFVSRAKALGGKWSAPAWVFDARDEGRVRDLCAELYGSDGSTSDVVTLRATYEGGKGKGQKPIYCGGRTVARAFGRDSGAKLGEGIVLLEGGFTSGGSVKNWLTETKWEGATVLIRDVPRALAERLIAEGTRADELAAELSIEPEAPVIDRDALATERARLVARIAEIDAQLGTAA